MLSHRTKNYKRENGLGFLPATVWLKYSNAPRR